jgi:hypothetical protein
MAGRRRGEKVAGVWALPARPGFDSHEKQYATTAVNAVKCHLT